MNEWEDMVEGGTPYVKPLPRTSTTRGKKLTFEEQGEWEDIPVIEKSPALTQALREKEYGVIEREPNWLERLAGRKTLPFVGGMMGGIAGFAAGGPAGGLAGATLGAGAGEAGTQIIQQLTGNRYAPESAWEATKKIGGAALYEGALPEATGTAQMYVASKIIPKVGKQFIQERVKAGGEELAPYISKYTKKPVTQGLLPTQVADEWSGAGKWQGIIESSFLGGGPIKKRRWAQEQGMKDYVQETVDNMFSNADKLENVQLGGQVQDAITTARKHYREIERGLYKNVDSVASGGEPPVKEGFVRLYRGQMGDYPPSTELADAGRWFSTDRGAAEFYGKVRYVDIPKGIADESIVPDSLYNVTGRLIPSEWANKTKALNNGNIAVDYKPVMDFINSVQKGRKTGSTDFGDRILSDLKKDIEATGGIDTFSGAVDLRQRLNAVISSKEAKGSPAYGLAVKLKGLITNQMDTAAKELGSDVFDLYRRANKFHAGYEKRFENDFISAIAKKAETHPSLVSKMIFKNDQPELVNMAMKAIKNERVKNNLRASYLEDVISKAQNQDGVVVGTTLGRELKNMGDYNLKNILGPETLRRLKTIETVSTATQKSELKGGGSLLVQLIQGRAISPALLGILGAGGVGATYGTGNPEYLMGAAATAAAVLAAPNVLARVIVHPVYGKWLIEGMNPLATRATTLKNLIRLGSVATRWALEEQKMEQSRQAIQSLPGQTIGRP